MHGPTFMGNALACSAALASIELFETQNYMEKIRKIEAVTRREMEGFTDPRIREVPDHGRLCLRRGLRSGGIERISGICLQERRVQPSVLKLSLRDGALCDQGGRTCAGASVYEGLVCEIE